MDYRSAGLIMFSALIMWAQHRHDHLGSAQLASEVAGVRYEACMAAERLARERNSGSAAFEDSDRGLPSVLSALTHVLSMFQQGVATLRQTLDEVRRAALLFGWQVLGDERPLRALLAARQPEPVTRCPREGVAALELVSPPSRANRALRVVLTP